MSKVVGASYSHADMLKVESLSLSGGTRPQTPLRETSSPSLKSRPSQTPPRKSYHRFLSDTSKREASRDNSSYDDLGLDIEDEEDEFGLPTLTTARSRHKNKRNGNSGSGDYLTNKNTYDASGMAPLQRYDSGDIAEERSLPSYPSAKPVQGKILRPQYQDILKDPANSLHLINHPPPPAGATTKETQDHSARITRINKFKRLLQATSIPLPELRSAAWGGVPEEVRAMTWQILLGYLPTNSERRVATLERKRKEYLEGVRQAFERGGSEKQTTAGNTGSMRGKGRGLDEAIWHQISIDVPRTNPHLALYAYEATQRSLERILYVWAIRHPASGYVQGINDLATPFWQTFLAAYVTDFDIEFGMDPGQLPKAVLDAVEADTFWCLTKLLDGIQDNYVHEQPGIHRQVAALRDLTRRIDATLAAHLEQEGIEFMQFSFRWMNCLLMREVSVKNVVRMWDTYLVSTFMDALCRRRLIPLLGRRTRLLRVPHLRLCCVFGQMVRPTCQDGFSRGHDVSPGTSDSRLDRQRR